MKTLWTGFTRFVPWLVRLILGVVSAVLLIILGFILIAVALGMATDDSDRLKTTTTVVESTAVTGPQATPAPGTVTTGTNSTTTVTETTGAESERSDTLIIALLLAGIALLLVALFWWRLSSIEIGPTGLKIALQKVAEKADEAKKQGNAPEQVAAAAVGATAKLLEMFAPAKAEPGQRGLFRTLDWSRGSEIITDLETHPAIPANIDRYTAAILADVTFDAELAALAANDERGESRENIPGAEFGFGDDDEEGRPPRETSTDQPDPPV